jgi:formate hydrogenlyase subunit 3/multisubunit Na+/H+ antiporter MnhD subunit
MNVLLAGLLIIPPLSAAVMPWLSQRIRARPPRATRPETVVIAIVAAITTVCALALMLAGEQEIHLPTWLPGTGAMSLHVGGAGLITAMGTNTALLIIAVLPTPARGEQRTTTPGKLGAAILLITLAAANAAFLAGHFLGRYVALEIVALAVALMHLVERRRDQRDGSHDQSSDISRASWVYLMLRLGDAGMLAAILILMTASGTLVIEPALAAAADLPTAHRVWMAGGFALAVWVKTAAWPFHGWLRTGQRLSPMTRGWLYHIVMPNLGIYLLYRVTAVLQQPPAFSTTLLILGVTSTLASAIHIGSQASKPQAVAASATSCLGGLSLVLALVLGAKAVRILLLAGIPLRLLLYGIVHRIPTPLTIPKEITPTTAHRKKNFSPSLINLAGLVRQQVEIGLLERSVAWAAGATTKAARTLHRTIEQGGLEALLRTTVRATIAASRWLQRRHTGQLRRNVAWIAAALVALLVVMVGIGW